MICPKCGHSFLPLPKLTEEVRRKIAILLDELEKRTKHLQEIVGHDWTGIVRDAAYADSMMPWAFQSPQLYIKAFGVLAHPQPKHAKESVRVRWIVDFGSMARLRKIIR